MPLTKRPAEEASFGGHERRKATTRIGLGRTLKYCTCGPAIALLVVSLKLGGGVVSCKSVQEKECISAGGYSQTENRKSTILSGHCQPQRGTFVSTRRLQRHCSWLLIKDGLFLLCHLHLTARRTGRLMPASPTKSWLTSTGVPGSGRPKALEGKRGDSTHSSSLGNWAPPRYLGAVQSILAKL